MPVLYVDTSALVKRYVGEVGTLWVRRALARPVRQRIYTALLAHTEVLSALQRKVRDGGRSRRPRPSGWHGACSSTVPVGTAWWPSRRRACSRPMPSCRRIPCGRMTRCIWLAPSPSGTPSSRMGCRRPCLSPPMMPCWRRPGRKGSRSTIRCSTPKPCAKWAVSCRPVAGPVRHSRSGDVPHRTARSS